MRNQWLGNARGIQGVCSSWLEQAANNRKKVYRKLYFISSRSALESDDKLPTVSIERAIYTGVIIDDDYDDVMILTIVNVHNQIAMAANTVSITFSIITYVYPLSGSDYTVCNLPNNSNLTIEVAPTTWVAFWKHLVEQF